MGNDVDLAMDLQRLDPQLRARLDRAGFDEGRLVALASTLREAGDPVERRRRRNTVKGAVTPPAASEIAAMPERFSPAYQAFVRRGQDALGAGQVAFCVMAGGMATRMGGIVKALAEVLPGQTFLDVRLSENRRQIEEHGGEIPLWLMTSDATDAAMRAALTDRGAPEHVRCFPQDLSLRLTPDGRLFRGEGGAPSTYATGHGDLVDAVRRSGLLDPVLARGGQYVWMTNIDNVGAAVDSALLGRFIESGCDVQGEVCPKGGDRGGIPVHAEGKLQVLEEFRLPRGFDPSTVDVFNTNTFLVRAEPLATAPLAWSYFEVEKKVDGRVAIQFERLIQEITAHLSTTFVRVPREGAGSRFLPVKDHDELAARRPTIEAVLRARGLL